MKLIKIYYYLLTKHRPNDLVKKTVNGRGKNPGFKYLLYEIPALEG